MLILIVALDECLSTFGPFVSTIGIVLEPPAELSAETEWGSGPLGPW
jgi:hypothetical protein